MSPHRIEPETVLASDSDSATTTPPQRRRRRERPQRPRTRGEREITRLERRNATVIRLLERMRINRDEALNDRDEALDGRDELHRALQSVTQQIVHMNGQIGALNDKVGALQAENTMLNDKVGAQNDKIGALEKENTAIGAQTKKLHKELLQERLDRIETDRKLQKEVQERRLLELEVVKLSASVREIGNKLERFQKASDLVTEAFELKEATRHRKLRSLFAAHQSIDTMQKWTLRGNRSVGPLPSQYERFCQDGPLFSA